MPNPDRLSGLDASFLSLERSGAHMHVGSVPGLRGRGAGLRGPGGRDRAPPAPRAALPPEARLPPARAGAARVDRRPALQRRLPRPPHRPARPGRRRGAQAPRRARVRPGGWTARSRCGSCGWSTRSATTASRSSPRPTTRWSTACRAWTSRPSSSTSSPTRRRPTRRRRGCRARSRAAPSCWPARWPSAPPRRWTPPAACCPPRATRSARGAPSAVLPRWPGPAWAGRRRARSTSASARTAGSPGWTPTSEQFKAVKSALGGTVNDVVLAAVAGALRSFVIRRGRDPEGVELRAMVPVSVRAQEERGALGNRVAAMYAPLPLYEPDAAQRFRDRPRGDGRPEVLRAGRRRRGADADGGLRGADDPRPGRPAAGAPALLQPRR